MDTAARSARTSRRGSSGVGRSIEPIDLELREGEVLGLAGLLGSGRTETARLLFGVDAADSGHVEIDGVATSLHSPRQAIGHRIAFCPEDRKAAGIIPIATGGANGSGWELELGVGVLGPSVYGADFYDKMMKGEAKFTDPKYVAALQRFKDMLPYYEDGFAGTDYTAATQLFVTGKAAMFLGGSFENGSFRAQNPDLKFSVFAFPGDEPTDNPVVSAFCDGSYGLVDTSTKKEAALKVLNWMASPEFAQLFADSVGWPAARPEIKSTDPVLSKMIAMQKNSTPYLTLVGYRWQAPTASDII